MVRENRRGDSRLRAGGAGPIDFGATAKIADDDYDWDRMQRHFRPSKWGDHLSFGMGINVESGTPETWFDFVGGGRALLRQSGRRY